MFGTKGARRSPGRVHSSSAGKYVTTAVIAAAEDPADVETAYKKAVQADAFNAEVLRELETFFFAYDEWGRGDSIKACMCVRGESHDKRPIDWVGGGRRQDFWRTKTSSMLIVSR